MSKTKPHQFCGCPKCNIMELKCKKCGGQCKSYYAVSNSLHYYEDVNDENATSIDKVDGILYKDYELIPYCKKCWEELKDSAEWIRKQSENALKTIFMI